MMTMKILVACEFSGAVRKACEANGHYVWSCDLLPSEDKSFHHYTGRVEELIHNPWDLMIAFPPCTYLAVSGARWFKDRPEKQKEALDFVNYLMSADIDKIAIENPVGVISTKIRKPDQIIHPYQFGDPYEKRTCLWLKNLPKLEPTNVVKPPPRQKVKGGKSLPEWYSNAPKKDRGKARSLTFPGIAQAMADQWAPPPPQ